MSRLVWILIPAGLIAASGCERKPAERAFRTVTSENVRRDAGQGVNTSIEFSLQAKEDLRLTMAFTAATINVSQTIERGDV